MGAEYSVRTLDAEEWEQWDTFVHASPQGTLFHTAAWMQASGQPFRIYGSFLGNQLHGGLVTVLADPLSAGHALLTPYLGVLLPPPSDKYVTTLSRSKRISAALAHHLKCEFHRVHCRFSVEFVDLQPFIWEGYVTSVRYTYRLNLDDLAQVWNNMDSTRRNDIRRAERDGICVDDEARLVEAFPLIESTFRRQGQLIDFKAAAFRYDALLSDTDRCRCFLARCPDGEALAAVYIVWDHRRAYYLLGGYDMHLRHGGAGALAMWKAIQFTAERLGLRQFDFEGSTIKPIERYFREFGGTLTPAYGVSWERQSLRRDLSRLAARVRRAVALG